MDKDTYRGKVAYTWISLGTATLGGGSVVIKSGIDKMPSVTRSLLSP